MTRGRIWITQHTLGWGLGLACITRVRAKVARIDLGLACILIIQQIQLPHGPLHSTKSLLKKKKKKTSSIASDSCALPNEILSGDSPGGVRCAAGVCPIPDDTGGLPVLCLMKSYQVVHPGLSGVQQVFVRYLIIPDVCLCVT